MSLHVVFRDEAKAEIRAAFQYYESQKPGLGKTFIAEAKKVFGRIGSHPELHAVVHEDIRRTRIARFPYCVYYRVEAGQVQVLSVFHTSRDPRIWQGRA